MKKIMPGVIILTLFFSISCENTKKIQDVRMENAADSVSYAIGLKIGENMKTQRLTEINTEILETVIRAILTDDTITLKMQGDTADKYIDEYITNKAKEEGTKFLEENGKKAGVTTTASGLQYEIVKSGTGATPQDGDQVTVHYVGKLVDGTEFDSTVKRGQPATYPVNGFVKGFTEALKMMKEGDKWIIAIPSEIAFGPAGAGGVIPPYAALVFEVELLTVSKATEPEIQE